MIHKSFSKQDIKDIIYDLNIHIQNYESLNKHDLINQLCTYLDNDNIIDFDNSEFFLNKDINYLKIYLNNQNPNKLLSVKERNNILKLCKEIIHYCITGFCIENTIFGSIDELIIHMNDIKRFGDIPSVRRCCKLLKGDLKIIESLISIKMKRELEFKRLNKIQNKKRKHLIIKRGSFKITFN